MPEIVSPPPPLPHTDMQVTERERATSHWCLGQCWSSSLTATSPPSQRPFCACLHFKNKKWCICCAGKLSMVIYKQKRRELTTLSPETLPDQSSALVGCDGSHHTRGGIFRLNSHRSPATRVRDLRNMPLSRANDLETRDTEFLENEENLIF